MENRNMYENHSSINVFGKKWEKNPRPLGKECHIKIKYSLKSKYTSSKVLYLFCHIIFLAIYNFFFFIYAFNKKCIKYETQNNSNYSCFILKHITPKNYEIWNSFKIFIV